jgi:hypothetical protein
LTFQCGIQQHHHFFRNLQPHLLKKNQTTIVMVSYLSLLASALALAAPIAAQSAQIVPIINVLTTKTRNVQQAAQRINLIRGSLLLIGQGPMTDVVLGVSDIVLTAETALSQLDSQQTIAVSADADAINTAWATVRYNKAHTQARPHMLIET